MHDGALPKAPSAIAAQWRKPMSFYLISPFYWKNMNHKYTLQIHGLPTFETVFDLAEQMHISYYDISLFVRRGFCFYKKIFLFKPGGGFREILQPCKELKSIQAWILRNILDKLTPSSVASAYIIGRKPLFHTKPHNNNRYFYLADIKDFFPSITNKMVYSLFLDVGYSGNAASILTKLTTCNGVLPQGAVTSPAISNYVCLKLDKRLFGFTSRRNIAYTRYADDMVFSSNNRNELNLASKTIKRIIENEGFNINKEKTRYSGPRKNCNVIGLVKNTSEPEFRIGMRKKRKMRAIIYNAIKNNVFNDDKYKSMKSIEGWISYVKSVDMKSYKQICDYMTKL